MIVVSVQKCTTVKILKVRSRNINKEIKEEVRVVLDLLKKSLIKNNMSIGFDKETESLLFFDTKQYVENKNFDGFKIKLEELVR